MLNYRKLSNVQSIIAGFLLLIFLSCNINSKQLVYDPINRAFSINKSNCFIKSANFYGLNGRKYAHFELVDPNCYSGLKVDSTSCYKLTGSLDSIWQNDTVFVTVLAIDTNNKSASYQYNFNFFKVQRSSAMKVKPGIL